MKRGVHKKVDFLKTNKWGVLIRSGGLVQNCKVNKRGVFIWHLKTRVFKTSKLVAKHDK